MTSKTFTSGTVIDSAWLNDVNGATYSGSAVYTPAGTGAVATTVQAKERLTVDLDDYMTAAQKADCYARTGLVDQTSAFTAALAAVFEQGTFVYPVGGRIRLPKGLLYCASTLTLAEGVTLVGHGAGQQGANWATSIKFPASVTGIRIQKGNTGPNQNGGDGSIIEGVYLQGGGGVTTAHGIDMQARAVIRDCSVSGFGGNGINIVANAGSRTNANNWRLDNVSSILNGLHGLYVDGPDANAGVATLVDSSNNGGWGIYDSSFLGNTYVGCHAASNTLGPYKTDDLNACSVFVGCYSEGGQPPSSISNPSISIGGLHGAGYDSISKCIIRGTNQGSVLNQATVYSTDGTAQMGLGWGALAKEVQNLTYGSITWRLKYSPGKYFWDWANAGEFLTYYDANSVTFANGYPRDLSGNANPNLRTAPVGLPLGYFDKGMLARITLSSIPTSYTWLQGDIVYNSAPVSAGFIGWVCTTSGTLGTLNGGATTGSITSGTPTLTVSSATGLIVGQYITIATVAGVYQISAIVGTTVTLTTNASSSATGQAVAFSNAVFKTFGLIS